MLPKNIRFRDYIKNYETFLSLDFKTKKASRTALLVLFGKKKDRGNIRKKYNSVKEYNLNLRSEFTKAVNKICPQLSGYFGNYFNGVSYGF